jgi:hypothetical protein
LPGARQIQPWDILVAEEHPTFRRCMPQTELIGVLML